MAVDVAMLLNPLTLDGGFRCGAEALLFGIGLLGFSVAILLYVVVCFIRLRNLLDRSD